MDDVEEGEIVEFEEGEIIEEVEEQGFVIVPSALQVQENNLGLKVVFGSGDRGA